jgi:hypothetical protein
VRDGPEDGDPALMFYGLPLLAVAFAVAGSLLNPRRVYGVSALAASLVCLVTVWILAVLSSG